MVSTEARGFAAGCPERIEGGDEGRDGTLLGDAGPLIVADEPLSF